MVILGVSEVKMIRSNVLYELFVLLVLLATDRCHVGFRILRMFDPSFANSDIHMAQVVLVFYLLLRDESSVLVLVSVLVIAGHEECVFESGIS